MMLLAVTIGSLLLLEIGALESPEFTRVQEFRTLNGTFVVQSGSIAGGMFRVSLSNRTIDVKPTSSSLKACKGIVIDPFEDAIEGEIRATLMETYSKGTIIVIWGVGHSEIVNSSRIISYTMLLVDLEKCESKAVWLPNDRIHSHQRILLPEVQIGFNVYFASQQYCSPCLIDAYGSHTAINKLEAEDAEPADNFHLRLLYSVEGSHGYFYAFNFINGTAVVKLLGFENYRPRRIRYLNHRVDVISVKNGAIRNVGYCYQVIQSPNELHCERLDSKLQSVVSVLVPLDQPARKFSLEYDEQGNSYVAVVLSAEVRVFVYGIFGELLATLDFGSLQDTGNLRDLSAYIDADQYCLFYSIQHQASNDASNIFKCINRTLYIG